MLDLTEAGEVEAVVGKNSAAIAAAGILVVLVVGLPLYAVAITPDARYTGCLKISDGSLYGIAEGSQPATDCKKDRQITLADYDPGALDAEYVNEADHTGAAHDDLTIDADTLDGIDSSAFAAADHEHAISLDDINGTPCNQDSAYHGTLNVDYAEPSGAVSFVCAPNDLPTRSFTVQLTGEGVGSVSLDSYSPTVEGFEPSGTCEPVVGGSCTFVVPASTTSVRVSAAAPSGSAMAGWKGVTSCEWGPVPSHMSPDDSYQASLDLHTCTLDPFAHDLSARFEPTVPVTLTVEGEGITHCWGGVRCEDFPVYGVVASYPYGLVSGSVKNMGFVSNTFTGAVPKGVPVGLYAAQGSRFHPYDDTHFVGWRGDIVSSERGIVVDTDEPVSVTALFEVIPTDG